MIRVVQICASDIHGGAAIAAYRLHRSFRDSPTVVSKMLVRRKASDDDSVMAHVPEKLPLRRRIPRSLRYRALAKIWSRFVTANQVTHSRADIRTGLMSSLSRIPCDLIHLHWLGDHTASVEEIGELNKPVVWTFHDMWAFCGAEHYAPDGPNARFRLGYHRDNRTEGEAGPDLNRSVWTRKKKAWKRPMTIVCPSRWLADCAQDSVLFRNWPVRRIPNPLDLERWKPYPKQPARAMHGLPQNKRILMFGAVGGESNPRKGADLLRLALEELRSRNDFGDDLHLAVFGQSEHSRSVPFAYPSTYLGRLQDEVSMIAAYNCADAMLVPSRQDNLPQTAVEAHSCGIPVVAFKVGGLADIVAHRRTGYLATPFDVKDLASGIAEVLREKDHLESMSQSARQLALETFAEPVVSTAYENLYEQVLSDS